MVHAEKAHAILELWGSGLMETVLRRRCDELRLADSTIFRGHVEDVRSHLPEMDVFVLPSQAEGNSNAVLEAMAAGLPIVSTRVGGTPMLVGHEGANFLCEPGDVDSMAANMLKLIRDPELRVQVGSAMRRRVERHFDISRVAQTYAAAYRFLTMGQRDRVNEASNPVILENGELGRGGQESRRCAPPAVRQCCGSKLLREHRCGISLTCTWSSVELERV